MIKKFKLKPTVPKVKVVLKPSAASAVENKIDDLAKEYITHRDKAKSEQAAADRANVAIKTFASSGLGQAEDKSLMCYGKQFVIGISETVYAPKIDLEKMRLALPKEIFKQCVRTAEVPDEARIKDLVDSGIIPKKKFMAMLTAERAPVKKVYVATKRQHMAYKDKHNETEKD